MQSRQVRQSEAAPEVKPIWEKFEEIVAGIPKEVWDKIAADSSEQLDHYLYGTPSARLDEASFRGFGLCVPLWRKPIH